MCETKALWLARPLWVTLFIFLALGRPTIVQGQQIGQTGVRIDSIAQRDQDDDGNPDLTVIECSFATDDDRVLVFDGAGDMEWAEDWRKATDFENDVWIFDVGADGSAQLVIRSSRDGDQIVADIFDDQDGDAAVSYDIRDGRVSVTESAHAPLRIVASGGLFLPNGQLNWNVLFHTDGSSVRHVTPFDLTEPWILFSDLDGSPDAEMQFFDEDRDGVPEYGLWRLLAPAPDIYVAVRTSLWANVGRHHPSQPLDYVFWPYLDPKEIAQNHFDAPPLIVVDWPAARIQRLSFPGYPIEQGFHVGTMHRFEPGVLNYANFENAQAYYDLAADRDGSPELHIRHRYFAAGDPHGWGLASPINDIRWSWSQASEDALAWDYKLGLAGRHTITSEASLGQLRYLTVPYQELPDWVLSRPWDYATFVCRENIGFQSSEGVYTWGAVEMPLGDDVTALSRFLAGEVAVDVRQAFQTVPVGWRGELAPELGAPPYLYYSPIDRRLHLLRAEYGLWQIDNSHQVHLADGDGDGYLDQWQHLVDGQLESQLGFLAGFLLYAGEGEVRLKPTAVEPASFETLPPLNHEQWLALGQKLEAHARDFAPGDLEALVAQFPGAEWRVAGARLRDLRPEGEGFRFVLELVPGFRVQGSDGPDLTGLSPGSYLVTYTGAFTVRPLVPARVQLVPDSFQLSVPAPVAVQPLRIEAILENAGLEDLPSLWVQAYVQQPGSTPSLVAETEVALLAGQPVPVSFVWAPPAPGEWQVSLAWGQTPSGSGGGGSLTAGQPAPTLAPDAVPPSFQATLEVDVQSLPHLTAGQLLPLSNVGQGPVMAAFLLAIGLLGSSLLLISIRAAGGKP